MGGAESVQILAIGASQKTLLHRIEICARKHCCFERMISCLLNFPERPELRRRKLSSVLIFLQCYFDCIWFWNLLWEDIFQQKDISFRIRNIQNLVYSIQYYFSGFSNFCWSQLQTICRNYLVGVWRREFLL